MKFGSLSKLEEISRTDESPSKILHNQSGIILEDDILTGAQSRQQNFLLHVNDQNLLQQQQRNRLNSQESYLAMPQTPETIQQIPSLNPFSNNAINQVFFTSPSQPAFPFGEPPQVHKNSVATFTTYKNGENYNQSNNYFNNRSTNSQTPQTLKLHKDSYHFNTAGKTEDDNLMRPIKLMSNEFDAEIRKNYPQPINIRKNSSFSQSNNNFLNNPSSNQGENNNNEGIQHNEDHYKFTIANHINCQVNLAENTEKESPSQKNIVPFINMKKAVSTQNNEGTEETDSQQWNKENTNKGRAQSKGSSNQRKSRFSGVLGSPMSKGILGSDFLKNMNIMKHARQFMNKLVNFTLQSNFKYLKQKHFDMIADPSAFFVPEEHLSHEEQQQQNQLSTLNKSAKSLKSLSGLGNRSMITQKSYFTTKRRELNKLLGIVIQVIQQIPVFDPESLFFVIWDSIMLIFQVIIFLLVPLAVSFVLDLEIPGIKVGGISAIAGSFFFLDSLLTLNRGVYISGVAVLDRSVIAKNYLKNILFTDFLTLIALANFNNYVQLLILMRFFYIKVLIVRLDDHFSIRMKFPDLIQFSQMIASTIMIAHLCACGFHLVSRLSVELGGYTNALIVDQKSAGYNWFDMYITCLYFAFITMSTVGYGDVVPKNNAERIYVMIMTMLSSAVFGYVINTIGQIYTNKAQKRAIFEQRKFDIITYMVNRNIPKHMQMRTIKYLEYSQFQKNENHLRGQAIIDQLPSQLSSEIKQEFFGKILHAKKLFNSHFSTPVINKLSLKMKELSLGPGEFLIQAGSNDNRIYFLLEGSLSIHIECKNGAQKKIASIDEKYFMIGQRSFFCQQSRTKSVKCEKTSNFAYCDLKDFKEILLNYPVEYEVFCEIRDSILYDDKSADTSCASCDKFCHTFQNCPLIHLKLNKSKIIYSHTYCEAQTRQKLDVVLKKSSRSRKSYQALRDKQITRQHLKQIRIEYAKQQLLNEEKEKEDSGTQWMARYLVQEEIRSYEQYYYTIVDDKQFYISIPEIAPLLPLTEFEEQYLQQNQYNQMLTSEIDEEEDMDDDDIEDYLSSQEAQNEDIIDNDKQSEKIHQIPSYSHISERTPISSINTNIISAQKIDLLNHSKDSIKQNMFAKSTQDETFDLKKNLAPSAIQAKNQQEDQIQFNILPRHNSETSIHSSLKEPQTFQYIRQQSSQSVKFSQNQVYSNQNQILKDSIPQPSSQQQQALFPQSLNEQLIKLINQAIQQNQLNNNNNNNNNVTTNMSNINNQLTSQQPQTISSGNSLTVQQPISANVRRPSIQRVISRKGTHKKSVTIMRQKTLKLTSQATTSANNVPNTFISVTDQQHQNERVKHQQFYFFDFEKMKTMTRYYPKYNMQNVVFVQNKYHKMKMTSIRKSQRKDNGDQRSTTIIGRNSVVGHSPTRRRQNKRASIINQPFTLKTKKIKQTIIIQS